jgi:hypothetical protein
MIQLPAQKAFTHGDVRVTGGTAYGGMNLPADESLKPRISSLLS